VPWRFSDAGRRSAWLASWVPAAKTLGLNISSDVLSIADTVIE
jgi:hypothetical protein